MSAWIDHVKDYAKQKEMKYTDALKSAECKELYHKNKSPVDKKKIDEMTRPKVTVQMEKVDKPKATKAKKVMEIQQEIKEEVKMETPEPAMKPPKKERSKKKT